LEDNLEKLVVRVLR